ncbi:MAG: Uma2 family endonuclease [Actinobacteria bacterium]|nr:Uma2 family endonuclease [Actinomycetota bacterium]
MRVLMLEAPDHFLEERHRLGHDHQDEMWEGVLHVVPQPSSRHQHLAHNVGAILLPLAQGKGLIGMQEPAVYRPGRTDSWRVPELAYAAPKYVSERGIEGRAELAVEIRSPRDETYDKLPFYAEMRCQELLVIDRDTCAVELFSLDGQEFRRTTGPVSLLSVGTTVAAIDGPGLRVTWDGGTADVVVL